MDLAMLDVQILQTLNYFDIQDHCLTLLEIHKYLLQPAGSISGPAPSSSAEVEVSLAEIMASLDHALAGQVKNRYGFYFLSGREELAEKRLRNNFFATLRLKRAKKYLGWAAAVPFITAIALTGSEAINNSKQGSDIDLLVLTKPGRIWLGRLFLTAYFQIFGVRRHGQKIADRFCLNHYIEQGKTLDTDQNIYTAIEYVSLVPYFGSREIYEFQQRNLPWINKYLAQPQIVEYRPQRQPAGKKFVEFLFANPLGNLLENIAGRAQRARIRLREHIVVADNELSFHPGSKGQQVLSRAKIDS